MAWQLNINTIPVEIATKTPLSQHFQESLWKFSENFQIDDFLVINLLREKNNPIRYEFNKIPLLFKT